MSEPTDDEEDDYVPPGYWDRLLALMKTWPQIAEEDDPEEEDEPLI